MSNTKWYLDEELADLSKALDEAYYTKHDVDEMENLLVKCYENAHNKKYSALVRARYFYVSSTAQANIIMLKKTQPEVIYQDRIKNLKLFELEYQKCVYLARNAYELIQNEKFDDLSFEEFINLFNFKNQLIVNYANLYYSNGRYTKATELLSIFADSDFHMGKSQLAIKIYELSRCHYDNSQQAIMLYKSYHYLQDILDESVIFPEKEDAEALLIGYKNNIQLMLKKEYLDSKFTINDFLETPKDTEDDEMTYRLWVSENRLALNLLNDVFDTYEVGYDPLHLPSMTEAIGSRKVQNLFGLFNQIKQEYVSARFLAYEGLTVRDIHFSDKEVYMVNTLDYPVYGLGIEKIKSAYRAIYSLFDKIAFFLNEYFELGLKDEKKGGGLKKAKADYVRVFSPSRTKNDDKKILELAENNLHLFGMWWLFKDIKNTSLNEDGNIVNDPNKYKHIDPALTKLSKVRNAMEHSYLKILDFYNGMALEENDRVDELAYNISFSDFEKLSLQLLKYAREAIFLLIFSIKRQEEINEMQSDPDKTSMPMYASQYEDEWKQIF